MRIALLGPLEVRTDEGTPVPVAGARLRMLLIRLALEPGRVVTPPQLIDAIWGEHPPDGSANALQALVSRLRRGVPDLPIESYSAGYSLAIDPQSTDVARFERLVSAGRAALADDPYRAAEDLRAALALWRGPALADAGDSDAVRAAVARLGERRIAALEELAAARLATGDDDPALLADLEAAVREHPTRELLVAALIRVLWTVGRPADALATYERTRDILADSLGTDPSPALRELHLSILRDEPAPTDHGRPRPSNLRAAITSFVGRDQDVSRVGKLVGEARLTTLIGPGGAGKTRLAIESARSLADQMRDGVWLVELAPLTDPGEVASTILAALGLREQALFRQRGPVVVREPTDRAARLAAALADKKLLLVLDNCEHLIDAVANLADRLLGDCPNVRILATSREPLAITGETLWTVEPLASPPPDADVATALEFAAVRLLADRAAAVRPGFAVEADNVAAVIHLCRALDGMPLAIELAAARLRTMTPPQITARLDDHVRELATGPAERFRLLTGGSRTALPRHQTLRAVVDWSWDLLDADERTLLRRLAVFTGGATREAVEAVCGLGGSTFDLLTALVDKSLVVTMPGEARYGMLETIRAYGLERLVDAGEADRVRGAHLAHFLDLAHRAEPRLRGAEQVAWLDRLSDDHENLHAAIRWAVSTGDAARALDLASSIGWYWWLRGHRSEGSDLAIDALALAGDASRESRALASAYAALNRFTTRQDLPETRRLLEEAVALAAEDPSGHPLLRLLRALAETLFLTEPAMVTAEAAFDAFRSRFDDPDPWVRAAAHGFYAHAEFNRGHDDAAEREFLAALGGFRAIGDQWGISFVLAGLAEAASGRGDHRAAAGYMDEATRLVTELGTNEDLAQIQTQHAKSLLLSGEPARARVLLAEARRTADLVGLPESIAGVRYEAGEFARAAGDRVTARHELERALAASSGWVAPQFRAMINCSLGWLASDDGDLATARAHCETALADAVASADWPATRRVLVGIARYALAVGDPGRAASLLGASADAHGRTNRAMVGASEVESAVRAALDERAFAEAHRRGRGTPLGDLTDLAALSIVDRGEKR